MRSNINKKQTVILCIIFALSMISLVLTAGNAISKMSKEKYEAEITFIGLPDGTVVGTFTDSNNELHKDVPLYQSSEYSINGKSPESQYGKKIKIVYDPDTDDIDKAPTFTVNDAMCLTAALLSGAMLLNKKRKINRRKTDN